MQQYNRGVLKAALDDIENLGAPRNIDAVCAVLGISVATFAPKGRVGMKSLIEAALIVEASQAAPKKRMRTKTKTTVA